MTLGKSSKKITPVMRQYLDAKQAHPDAILLFRLGDFYEMFFDDAVTASRLLDLTLTSRNKGDPDEVPMAGVPYHAVDGYIARLITAGHKVAICEQMADPSTVKGIVPRQVVRVVTPGLVTNEDQLDASSNNFLCAIDTQNERYGLTLLDISTGEMLTANCNDTDELIAELARLAPKEVLFDHKEPLLQALFTQLQKLLPQASLRDDPAIDASEGADFIGNVLSENEAKQTLAQLSPACIQACGRVLRMAMACNPSRVLPVKHIRNLDPDATLHIDDIAQSHLELVRATDGSKRGTLLSVIDQTVTPPGSRLLKQWLLSPLVQVPQIRRRQDAVQGFVQDPVARRSLREVLKQVGDLQRLGARALLGDATPKDLGVIRDSLAAAPEAIEIIRQMANSDAYLDHSDPMHGLLDLKQMLQAALVDRPPVNPRDGAVIREGFDKELDESRELQRHGTDLTVALEAQLKQDTGITALKVRYTRVFGWYLEVTKANLRKVPPTWRRKQTIATGERFTNDSLDEIADQLLHAEQRHTERQAELVTMLLASAAKCADDLARLGLVLATWDVVSCLAEVAHTHDYCRPLVDNSDVIQIRDGRHPVVEQLAAFGRFVPNDVVLEASKERFWLITGPNMAGKSTLMRQVAHIVLLAQMGAFVPAREARIGIVDRILSRVGASDNVTRGESTFMVEMRETASIIRQATSRSLVILDEIGRGTSTYDGLAIAWAVAEHIHDITRCRAMFATHYHELTEFAEGAKHARNYSVSARELGDDVVFLYKLTKGAASRSYGIAVAKLAGVSEGVLVRARTILQSLETGQALPGGRYATLRGRTSAGQVQLDLFGPPPEQKQNEHPVVQTLREVDPDRLSPIEALQLIIKLQEMAGKPERTS